jgi:hypothetical protein
MQKLLFNFKLIQKCITKNKTKYLQYVQIKETKIQVPAI